MIVLINKINQMIKLIVRTILTCFFLGELKYCPGTFGSIFSIVFHYFIFFKYYSKLNLYHNGLLIEFFLILKLFILGIFLCSLDKRVLKKDDPKEIVFDEFVGQLITIYSVKLFFLKKTHIIYEQNIVLIYLLCFIFFRFFDIVKPYPINLVDKNIRGAWGVMLDDVLAGLLAGIAVSMIIYFFN